MKYRAKWRALNFTDLYNDIMAQPFHVEAYTKDDLIGQLIHRYFTIEEIPTYSYRLIAHSGAQSARAEYNHVHPTLDEAQWKAQELIGLWLNGNPDESVTFWIVKEEQ
jgi:hypothetical protein